MRSRKRRQRGDEQRREPVDGGERDGAAHFFALLARATRDAGERDAGVARENGKLAARRRDPLAAHETYETDRALECGHAAIDGRRGDSELTPGGRGGAETLEGLEMAKV